MKRSFFAARFYIASREGLAWSVVHRIARLTGSR